MIPLNYFVGGYFRICFDNEIKGKIIILLHDNGIVYPKCKALKNGRTRIIIKCKYLEITKRILENFGDDIQFSEKRGMPVIAVFFSFRPGLAVGIILFAIIIKFLSGIIWGINITGNENISDSDIIEILENHNCSYGDRVSEINTDRVQTEILAENNGIAWMYVYLKGTVANVQVSEIIKIEEKNRESEYSNIIAKEDGIIESIYVKDGNPIVQIGNTVKKGDLLVSGVVMNGNSYGEKKLYLRYADAEVYARVNKKIEVSVPLQNEEKVRTGQTKRKISVKIFKKSINLFGNYGITYPTYDKIEKEEQLYLFDAFPLPVWIDTTECYETNSSVMDYDTGNAVKLGYSYLKDECDELLSGCEILNKSIKLTMDGNNLNICCDVECIEDISETEEFTAE